MNCSVEKGKMADSESETRQYCDTLEKPCPFAMKYNFEAECKKKKCYL